MKQYKVIEIIDTKQLLINYGYADGAQKGDILRIVEKGDSVTFEEKDYGTYDAIKAELSIQAVYEKFSVCKNNVTLSFSPLTELIAASMTAGKPSAELLDVDKSQLTNRKLPKLTPIKVGDPVVVLPKITR